MKVIITGISGLIGSTLARVLSSRHEVYGLTRDPSAASARLPEEVICYPWDGKAIGEQVMHLFQGRYALINLAGEPVAARPWTDRRRKAILESRTHTVDSIFDALESAEAPPQMIIQASATGYYGCHDHNVFTESSPKGGGFLSHVAAQWEQAARARNKGGYPIVFLRTGVVLSMEGGALPAMLRPLRVFMGAIPGKGAQWMPWIHLRDHVSAIAFVLENNAPEGVYNFTAPNPVTMEHLIKCAGHIMKKPVWGKIPEWAIKGAMGSRGEELMLKGARVIPEKLLKEGFAFQWTTVEDALEDLLKKNGK